MNRLEQYRREREIFTRHTSLSIDAKRAKLELNDREIKGYAIVWGSKNDYDEMVMQGATLRSLNDRGAGAEGGNRILLLLHHDPRQPLCVPAELREDDYGLFFRAEIDTGISYCDDTVASVRQGTLSQLSYGFNYVWGDNKTVYDAALDAFVLREIDLYELSLVSFSSDPLAQLRSRQEEMLASLLAGSESGRQFVTQELRARLGLPAEGADDFTNSLKMF